MGGACDIASGVVTLAEFAASRFATEDEFFDEARGEYKVIDCTYAWTSTKLISGLKKGLLTPRECIDT
jgi:hypothetical protein